MAAMTDRLARAVAWGGLLLSALGFVLVTIGLASLQAKSGCDSAKANALAAGGAVGFLGPVPCKKWLSFAWTIWAFQFAVTLLGFALVRRAVAFLRAGVAGLLALEATLLFDMTNTFLYFNALGLEGKIESRAATVVAGAAIGAAGLLAALLALGSHDERREAAPASGAPKGETYGGVFRGPSFADPAAEPGSPARWERQQ